MYTTLNPHLVHSTVAQSDHSIIGACCTRWFWSMSQRPSYGLTRSSASRFGGATTGALRSHDHRDVTTNEIHRPPISFFLSSNSFILHIPSPHYIRPFTLPLSAVFHANLRARTYVSNVQQGAVIKKAWAAQRDFLVMASKCKKPDQTVMGVRERTLSLDN